jgi:glycine oxidase
VKNPSCIVIGGGIIGCAVACELARRGTRVRLIEGRSVGAGATQASAGILAPYIEGHDHGALFDLTLRSLALYDDFVSAAAGDSGFDVEYRRCGSLEIADDEATAEAFRNTALTAGAAVEWLSMEAARHLEPSLPDTIHGALHVPTHGYVGVTSLVEALSWAALRHGAEIETGRHIRGIEGDGDGLQVIADDGARWSADVVVVAAGSWSGQLEPEGAPAGAVRPVRGQLLRLAWTGTPIGQVIWGKDCYVVPWRDGTVLVGATVEDVGFDERTTAAGVRDLLDAVCELLPEAWRATFIEARAGLRPATPDQLPVIGRSPSVPGLVYATGHYRNGVLLAPLTAKLVADLILISGADPALTITAPSRPL